MFVFTVRPSMLALVLAVCFFALKSSASETVTQHATDSTGTSSSSSFSSSSSSSSSPQVSSGTGGSGGKTSSGSSSNRSTETNVVNNDKSEGDTASSSNAKPETTKITEETTKEETPISADMTASGEENAKSIAEEKTTTTAAVDIADKDQDPAKILKPPVSTAEPETLTQTSVVANTEFKKNESPEAETALPKLAKTQKHVVKKDSSIICSLQFAFPMFFAHVVMVMAQT